MSGFSLPQTITYWLPLRVDGDGVVTYFPGVAIAARWIRKDGTTTDEKGTEQKTTHVVYSRTLIPKRAKVSLSALDLDGDANPPAGTREVIASSENPSMTDMFRMLL